jgi:hypothetical protein
VVVEGLPMAARPDGGLWNVAVEYVVGPRKLKIVARGEWTIEQGRTRGPDGDAISIADTSRCLAGSAPRGCLIAKIGGGTADFKGHVVAIGRFAVIDLDDPTTAAAAPRGALFLTMNDEPGAFHAHAGAITVDIWEAP